MCNYINSPTAFPPAFERNKNTFQLKKADLHLYIYSNLVQKVICDEIFL
jgi:hypothetical protein